MAALWEDPERETEVTFDLKPPSHPVL